MKFISSLLYTAVNLRGKIGAKKSAALPLEGVKTRFSEKSNAFAFTVGFAKEVLLPDDIDTGVYYIAGYGENNPARGVIDPQYVHAVFLDDNSGRGGVLLVSIDAVGLLNKDVQTIRNMLSDFCEKTGCRKIDVMCTHNHAGIDTMGIWGRLPLSGKNKKFMQILFDATVKAAFCAYQTRTDGDLYLGSVNVPDMQEDTRTPRVYSETLTRFRFVPFNGGNEIWILNFASHSESLQGCNHLVSADFPGYMREKIKADTGADVLYTVGAIGGMISMKIDDEPLLRKEHRLVQSTRNIGYKLADYAMSVSNDVELTPLINFATEMFYVPVENPVLTLACDIGILSADKYVLPNGCRALKTEVTYYEIGGKKILLLPCELFPELAFGGALNSLESATAKDSDVNPPLLCDITGDSEILIFGLANDELGYVLPPNDFLLNEESPYLEKAVDVHGRRHYEETNSLGPKTADVIAEAVSEMIADVNAQF